MCTLTRSVRWLEEFFRAYPVWAIQLAEDSQRNLKSTATNTQLWNDIFAYRFDFYPRDDEEPAWSLLLGRERMLTAFRVIERRLAKP